MDTSLFGHLGSSLSSAGLVGADEATIDTGTYALAVFVALLISCLQSLGMGLQKRVHLDLAALPEGAPRLPYYKHARWLGGLGSMTVASLMVIANYTLLGQSRASAFAALTVVTNCVMAKYYLRENFTRYDAAAAALILSGVSVCAIFGASAGTGAPYPLRELVVMLSNVTVYVASALAFVVAVGLAHFVRRSHALGAARPRWMRNLECAARALLGGIFSGSTGFFMKGVTAAVANSFRAKTLDDTLRYGFFYLFLAGLPTSLVFQLRVLNAGLANFDAVEIVPMYQASMVMVGVGWGWVFYQENKDLEANQVELFALGCAVSVLGIAVLGFKPSKRGGEPTEGESAPLLSTEDEGLPRAAASEEAPAAISPSLPRNFTLNPFGKNAAPEKEPLLG
jgi:hypothetical protein